MEKLYDKDRSNATIYENESQIDNPYGKAHLYTERIIDKVYNSKAIPIGIILNNGIIDYLKR